MKYPVIPRGIQRSLIASIAICLAPVTVHAQDDPALDEDAFMLEDVAPADASDLALSADEIAARRTEALPAHISVVVSMQGQLATGYSRQSLCIAGDCGDAIIEVQTGDVVFFADTWMAGYIVTGNSDEVWHVDGAVEVVPPG